jgi:thioredoxin
MVRFFTTALVSLSFAYTVYAQEVITVTTQVEFNTSLATDKPVIIDCFSPWCGPCQRMLPIFHELAKQLSNQVKFITINVKESESLTTALGIRSVPTFLFYKKGTEHWRTTGQKTKAFLAEQIQKLIEA